ncbi:MAG: hypothetical protein QW273_01840 [Candidatus Pacearchaeota archaeon]
MSLTKLEEKAYLLLNKNFSFFKEKDVPIGIFYYFDIICLPKKEAISKSKLCLEYYSSFKELFDALLEKGEMLNSLLKSDYSKKYEEIIMIENEKNKLLTDFNKKFEEYYKMVNESSLVGITKNENYNGGDFFVTIPRDIVFVERNIFYNPSPERKSDLLKKIYDIL